MAVQLQAIVSLNAKPFQSGLAGLRQTTMNATNAMMMSFGGVAGEVFMMTKAFGPIGGLTTMLKSVISVGAEFGQQMANVSSVTGLMGDELQKVANEAQRFAATTAFTTTQAAEALYALGSAGISTADGLMNTLTPALLLAGATQSDVKTATEALTATLASFSLQTEKAIDVANLFAGAIAASPANMERLSEAMKEASPVAAAFGMSLDDTVASIAAFHKVGIMGSRAGTNFRQAMMALQKSAGMTQETMDKLIASAKESGSAFGMAEGAMSAAKDAIKEALAGWAPGIEGMTGAIERLERAGISGEMVMGAFGARGGRAVAAQLALGSKAIREMQVRIASLADVQKMYGVQMATTQNQWNIVKSQIQKLAIMFSGELQPAIQGTISVLQRLLKGWDEEARGMDAVIQATIGGGGLVFALSMAVNKMVALTTATITFVKMAIPKLIAGLASARTATVGFNTATAGAVAGSAALGFALGTLIRQIPGWASGLDKAAISTGKFFSLVTKQDKKINDTREHWKALREEMNRQQVAQSKATLAAMEQVDAQNLLDDAAAEARNKIIEQARANIALATAQKAVTDGIKPAISFYDTFQSSVGKLNMKMMESAIGMRALAPASATMETALRGLKSATENAMEPIKKAGENTGDFKDNMGDLTASVEKFKQSTTTVFDVSDFTMALKQLALSLAKVDLPKLDLPDFSKFRIPKINKHDLNNFITAIKTIQLKLGAGKFPDLTKMFPASIKDFTVNLREVASLLEDISGLKLDKLDFSKLGKVGFAKESTQKELLDTIRSVKGVLWA